jgi:predicted MFS family arabinose efflux permease
MSTLKSRPFLILIAGFLVLFIGGGARLAIGLTLKPMVEELGWGRSELGVTVAVFQVVTAIAMFYAGKIADTMSLRLVLGGGVALGGLTIGAMCLVTEPWHAFLLYGVAFAIGNGVAATTPVAVMVTRAYPHKAGMANAIALGGMSVGQLVVIAVLAAVMVSIGWRSVYIWLGAAHFILIPLILAAVPGREAAAQARSAASQQGMTLREASRTKQFWLLIGIFAICGFDDFFVTTHVVAFAQDRGLDAYVAGNLLAAMGIVGLMGVILAGGWGDKSGPIAPTIATFVARVAVFGLVAVDQSQLSVMIFALVFGVSFLATAPLTVLFIRDSFGTRNLGAIGGLIVMVHHMCGGLGAYIGAVVFDGTGSYDVVFIVMCVASLAAALFTWALSRAGPADPSLAALK